MWNKGPIMSFPHSVIVVNTAAETFDESGDLVSKEEESFWSPAFVDTSLGSREYKPAPAARGAVSYSATVYMPVQVGITNTSRIVWDDRVFEVAAPIDYGFGYILAVPCVEVKL